MMIASAKRDSSGSDSGQPLERILSGALLGEKFYNRAIMLRLRSVKRSAAVCVGGIDIDTKFNCQLDGFECQSFALGAGGLNPRCPAAHPCRGHQSCGLFSLTLKAFPDQVFRLVHKPRI